MKKTNIIGICISIGALVALVLVFVFAFTLNTVNFQLTAQFKQTTRSRLFANGVNTENLQEKMQEDAEFKIGCNLLFTKFDSNIEKIEENNPYVKVEKIVRSFPNKLTVYYSEREPVALLHSNDADDLYYVVDTDLKVLDAVTYDGVQEKYISSLSATQPGYVLPVVDDYGEKYTAEVGKIIDNEELKTKIKTIVAGALSAGDDANALFEDVLEPCSNITFETVSDDKRATLVLSASNGHIVTATIYSVEDKYFAKVSMLWKVYLSNLKLHDTSDATVVVYVNNSDTYPEYKGKVVVVDKSTENVINNP